MAPATACQVSVTLKVFVFAVLQVYEYMNIAGDDRLGCAKTIGTCSTGPTWLVPGAPVQHVTPSQSWTSHQVFKLLRPITL